MDGLSLDAGLLQQVLQQEQQIREVKGRKAVLKNLHEATKASLQDIEINVKETEAELETSEQVSFKMSLSALVLTWDHLIILQFLLQGSFGAREHMRAHGAAKERMVRWSPSDRNRYIPKGVRDQSDHS